MRLLSSLTDLWLAQRAHLIGWVPVCFGCGIGAYFAAPVEPSRTTYIVLSLLALSAAIVAVRCGAIARPLLLGLALLAAGVLAAGYRSHATAAPVLGFRYYGPVEGRIVTIDRSGSDAVRLLLDRVRLDRMSPERTPIKVRISLHGDDPDVALHVGDRVMTTAHLSPPSGPAEPGGFDFRRLAWFQQLGAVGYTRNPVLRAGAPEPESLWLNTLRARISRDIREDIPGDEGGFAAAIMTGDRSGLSTPARDAMRASNLFHLISISGMHMGMLAGFVFGVVRYGAALIPPLALRVSSRKLAALVALPAAAFYLALAGRAIPTERAFIMVAVMLVAVLFDRRALTMRSVAIAAMIVLVLRPESLLNPGFQMSFSAVVALVFAFSHMNGTHRPRPMWQRVLMPVVMLCFSSLVAGSATAPYAAAHFNRVAHYGVLANLFAVPVMGLIVMPGAVILAVLGPLGLGGPALWMIETGSSWILSVAGTVSALDGAVTRVVKPGPWVLPILTLAGCFFVLWQGQTKWVAAVPATAAALMWSGAERPAVLVADSGGLIGVLSADGRALSRERGHGFVAEVWLENDGVALDQAEAADLPGLQAQGRRISAQVGTATVMQISGVTEMRALADCAGADILILNVEDERQRDCTVYDIRRLRQTGALAITPGATGVTITTASELSGDRLWTRR